VNTFLGSLDDRLHRPYKVAVLVDALAELGVQPADVLAGTGLVASTLHHPATLVSVRQLLAVIDAARRLTPRPDLALRAGTRVHITHFGMYGYALLASPTPREAVAFATQYRALASPLVGLSFRVDGAEAVWTLSDDVLDLGPSPELRRFVLEMQVGTLLSLHRDLVGAQVAPAGLRAAYPAPAHAAAYGELLGCPVVFDAPAHELRFDAAWLNHPLALGNPITAAVVRRTCDELLGELQSAAGTAAQVSALLMRSPGQFPDIEAVAAQMYTTSRTLRRRLQTEETSFQQVLDEVRRRLALEYLQNTTMSTDSIAASLGFSDTANFRHAFKKWTGRSPGSYR
jgi:AraC-like DNA-binding protein